MAAVTSTRTATPALLLLLLLVVALVASTAAAVAPGSFGGIRRIPTTVDRRRTLPQLHELRGGAVDDDESDDDESEYDSEYDSDDEEEEPIVTKTKKLASSTKTVVQKKKAAAAKARVKVAMASSSSATKSVAKKRQGGGGGGLYQRCVPYIIRACLNPFTFFAMTKAYFVSLCDIDYLKEEQSQTLRSALEEKARKQQPPSGSTKPKRKMKPGQAKTLSDLPQLSA